MLEPTEGPVPSRVIRLPTRKVRDETGAPERGVDHAAAVHGCEQQAQQHDATSKQSSYDMHQHIQRQSFYIQEQRAALIQAQTELWTTIIGKSQYEAHAQEEMQSVARNYQNLEAHAQSLYDHREHQQHAKAMHEAQKQDTYRAAWEQAARHTEEHIVTKQRELPQVQKNLEMYA